MVGRCEKAEAMTTRVQSGTSIARQPPTLIIVSKCNLCSAERMIVSFGPSNANGR